MRTLILILTGLMIVSAAPAASVPRPSPELTMQRDGAPPIKLSQFRGKIVALVFGQTTCDHCQDLTRTLKVMSKELGLPIVLLSQLSRAMEKRDKSSRRPMLSARSLP